MTVRKKDEALLAGTGLKPALRTPHILIVGALGHAAVGRWRGGRDFGGEMVQLLQSLLGKRSGGVRCQGAFVTVPRLGPAAFERQGIGQVGLGVGLAASRAAELGQSLIAA